MCILTEVILRARTMSAEDMQSLLCDLYKVHDIIHDQKYLSLTEDQLSTAIDWLEREKEESLCEEEYARQNARTPK